jgi:PAS domain S-box-containing protein
VQPAGLPGSARLRPRLHCGLMILPSLSLPAKRLAADLMVVLGVVAAGLLSTAAVYSNLREAEALRIYEQRSALAETVLGALDHDATSTIEAVRGAGLMAEMQPAMTRAQFDLYANRLKMAHPTVAALEWQKMEASEGFVFPTNLKEWTHQARPLLDEAQKDARVVGTPIATGAFAAVTPLAEGAKPAVIITVPVYQRSADTDSISRHIGFINALVDVATLARNAAYQAEAAGNELIVRDRETSGDAPLFTSMGSTAHTPGHDKDSAHRESADYALELNFGSRNWELLLHPKPELLNSGWVHQATFALVLGLLVTALLTILLTRSQINRRRSETAIAHEQALRDELLAEQYRLKEVVESTGVAIWEYDLVHRFLSVSERWHVVSGYSREELGDNVLTSWLGMVHPEDRPRISATFADLTKLQGDRFEYEYRMRQKDGQWMWVQSLAHIVARDGNGQPIKVAGINLEVTQQKEAEIRIHALNASLEAQMQEAMARSEARATLGTLIASVSHEMATPMGNSMMTASTLVAQANQFEQQMMAGTLKRSELAQFVGQVQSGNELLLRNLERAVALLKNFRQVAADQASEQRRTFDLQQGLREILDTLAPSLKRQSHTVLLEAPEGIRIDSYPGPLGQVLINLINNAYLHAFEGMEHGEVRISATADETQVTLVCTDNGRGIAPDTLEKMFQPFFSTRIGRGGTGLGMSIVENLVKATLGGTLEVQSAVGQGTTVTITLPRSAPEPRQEEEGA